MNWGIPARDCNFWRNLAYCKDSFLFSFQRYLPKMNKSLSLMVLAFLCFLTSQAQNSAKITLPDTVISVRVPVLLRPSFWFTNKLLGAQVGLGKTIVLKEKHVFKRSGKEKISTKSRVLYGNLGYYDQPGLHQNALLTAEYVMTRTNRRGFYTEFTPLLGVSRTFLPGTAYEVDNAGAVSIDRNAGNWTLTGGFGLGLGKSFENKPFGSLETISARLVTQVFYPNFRFVSLKPSFQLNTTWELNRLQTRVDKKIKYRYRHEK